MRFIQSGAGLRLVEQCLGKDGHEDKRGEHGERDHQDGSPGLADTPIDEDEQQEQQPTHRNNGPAGQQHNTVRSKWCEQEESRPLAEGENDATDRDLLNKKGEQDRPGRHVPTVLQTEQTGQRIHDAESDQGSRT